jgi:hypothetical protein
LSVVVNALLACGPGSLADAGPVTTFSAVTVSPEASPTAMMRRTLENAIVPPRLQEIDAIVPGLKIRMVSNGNNPETPPSVPAQHIGVYELH